MPRKLKGIKLDEISAVDIPADPNAKMTFHKRANTKGGDMDPQELAKKLKELEGQVSDLTKRAEGSETALEALKKSADEAGFDVSDEHILTKRAEPEFVEINGEKFEKSAVPAPILKQLEAQAADLATLKKAGENAILEKRGKTELPNLPGADLAKGELLAAVGDNEEIMKSLKAADAAIAKQMTELGDNPLSDESSATFRLNKMATDYAAEHGVTQEQGFAEVTKSAEGSRLMREARQEAN
jgi:hypothetical protein